MLLNDYNLISFQMNVMHMLHKYQFRFHHYKLEHKIALVNADTVLFFNEFLEAIQDNKGTVKSMIGNA
jgi:hypothetical protein